MQLPVTSRPWKEKPPAEKWTVVGVLVGAILGMAIFIFGRVVDSKPLAIASIFVTAVLGGVILRLAYELSRRNSRSA